MNLIDHYNELYNHAIQKIQSDEYELDALIDSPTDNRFGITLLARPDKNVKRKFKNFWKN